MSATEKFKSAGILLLLACLSESAFAASTSYEFESRIRYFGFAPSDQFSAGAVDEFAEIGIVYDSLISGIVTLDSVSGVVQDMSFSVDGTNFDPLESDSGTIVVQDNSPVTSDYIGIYMYVGASNVFVESLVQLQFQDSTNLLVQNNAIPDTINLDSTDPFQLHALNGTGFLWLVTYANETNVIQSELTSFARVVPVPAAFWLLLSALAGSQIFRRRNNQ